MKIKELSDYKSSEVNALIHRVPFFKELQNADKEQLDVLLYHSYIVELAPQETIMRRGDRGAWLYFLIKGRLSVYLDSYGSGDPINHVTPGELFGDLALLCDYKRKATVVADIKVKRVLLLATDFNVFGDLLDFTRVSIRTKLIFYRTMVHSIRWRLEVSKMESPNHSLVMQLRHVPRFRGEKGGREELEALYKQAQFLATLLENCNNDGTRMQDVVVVSPKVG